MRRQQVTRLVDLPAQFDLSKYVPPPGADLWYWVAMLEARILRRHMARFGEEDGAELKRGAARLLRWPQWPAGWPIGETGLLKSVQGSHIADRRVYDLFDGGAEGYIEDPRFERFTAAWTSLREQGVPWTDVSEILETPIWKMHADSGVTIDGDVEVTVNLHGSESKIVEDFRAWLRATRERLAVELPKRRVGPLDIESWIRYQLLAYLDLTLWAQVNDKEITQNLLGLALFPNEYEVALADRIRKVVSPLARSVGNAQFTDLLRAQALESEPEGRISAPDKYSSLRVTDKGEWILAPDE